jgi:hypothetical protein
METGLCETCAYAALARNKRGSVFLRCEYSQIDPAFDKYPRLPVLACKAYEKTNSNNVKANWRNPS